MNGRFQGVRTQDRALKCSGCPFYEKCMNQDGETDEARAMASDLDLLDVRGFLSILATFAAEQVSKGSREIDEALTDPP